VKRCSVQPVEKLSGHTNHLIHPGCERETQIVTASSGDRQARLDQLLPALGETGSVPLLQVLSDRAPQGLPIYRDDPADPDDENTLATALFVIRNDAVEFEVRQHGELRFRQFVMQEARPAAAS
jgi:hypothetical protein